MAGISTSINAPEQGNAELMSFVEETTPNWGRESHSSYKILVKKKKENLIR